MYHVWQKNIYSFNLSQNMVTVYWFYDEHTGFNCKITIEDNYDMLL